jgi:formylglycine-generating enzyme required for sulfatase activity
VTQAQWKAIMGSNPSDFKGDDLPVESVFWDDAASFCKKLSKKTGGKYRLPTETEWEYACRAGTTGARYRDLDEIAWHSGNSGNKTHPVAGKKPNALGLYDMIGNVWEWCADWYGEYEKADEGVTDPGGPSSGQYRVLRGGAWLNNEHDCRASFRDRLDPSFRSLHIGFRVARAP